MPWGLPPPAPRHRLRDALLAGVIAVYALGCLWLIVGVSPRHGIPAPSELQRITGELAWARSTRRYEIATFGLRHDTATRFVLPPEFRHYRSILERARGQPVTVSHHRRMVWELEIGERRVLTYAMTSAAQERDNRSAPLAGVFLLVLPIAVAYADERRSRQREAPVRPEPRGPSRRRKRARKRLL